MSDRIRIVVEAGEHDRQKCPISVDLPWAYKELVDVCLQEEDSKKEVACQIGKGAKSAKLSWVIDQVKRGEKKTYVASSLPEKRAAKPKSSSVCICQDVDASKLNVFIDDQLFTSYHYGVEWVRPFLHPVIGPYGVRVTRNWPVEDKFADERRDHPHHKSIWVAYGDCSGVDNWSEEPNHGWQRTRYINGKPYVALECGPVYGRFVVKTDWCTPEERKQFEDTREFVFYALPGGIRLFDLTLTFHMTQRDIVFRDTKEGGLISVRVATPMDVPRGGKIENAYGGINEKETWGKSSPWCDYSGVVEDKHVGIALFDHEWNPRYPTGWHVRNYGLMTANCFAWSYYRPEAKVKGHMHFKKNSRTTWRYRVYIHKGDAKTGKVADRFLDYISPPSVKIE